VGLNGRVCECYNSRCIKSQRWREKRVIQKVVTQTEFPLIHSSVLPPPTEFLCFFSISSVVFFQITLFITFGITFARSYGALPLPLLPPPDVGGFRGSQLSVDAGRARAHGALPRREDWRELRRVAEIEQQTEERHIALEMSRTEAETGPTEIQKRVDDVRLEVARLNRFHEHEQMAHSAAQPGIFAAGESAPPPPTQEVAMVLMGTASTYITGVVSLGLNPPMLRSQSRVRPRHHLVLILFLFLIHHVYVNLVRHLI
jgi:hypothetical protein